MPHVELAEDLLPRCANNQISYTLRYFHACGLIHGRTVKIGHWKEPNNGESSS